jgi:hypothetical protein
MSKPKTTKRPTKPKKINLTNVERTEFDTIIKAAMTSLSLKAIPQEDNLVRLGQEVISKASSASPNVKRALQERGNWMIEEGPRQQAARIGKEIEAQLKKKPKEKGDHRSLGDSVAAKLQELLESQAGAKLPPAVRTAIEVKVIPYYKNKGKQEHPGTREFEFLFEAPLPSLTPQFELFYEVPSSSNVSYYTKVDTERKYENQWLFEVPFLPGADYAERIPDKVDKVNITLEKKPFVGTDATTQAAILASAKKSPGTAYESLVKERFGAELKAPRLLKTTKSDATLSDGKTPVEITIHEKWNPRKKQQVREALEEGKKLVLYTPSAYGATAKKQINSIGRDLLKKNPGPFEITLRLT